MKKLLPFLLFLVILAAAVAGWFLLPDPVLVQFSADGKTLPKLLVLAVSVAIGAFGAAQSLQNQDAAQGERDYGKGGYIMMLIALALLALTFFVNR